MPHGDRTARMPVDASEALSPFSDAENRLMHNTESLRRAGKEIVDVREEEEIQEFLANDPVVVAAVKKFERIYEEAQKMQDVYFFETDPTKKAEFKDMYEAMIGTQEKEGVIGLAERDIRLAEESGRQIFLLNKALKAEEALLTRIQEHGKKLAQVSASLGPEKVPTNEVRALLADRTKAAVLAGDVAAYRTLASGDTLRVNMVRLPEEQSSLVRKGVGGQVESGRAAAWGTETKRMPALDLGDTTRVKMVFPGEEEVALSPDELQEIDDMPLSQEELVQVSVNVRMSALDNERQNIRGLVIPEEKQRDIFYLKSLERQAQEIMNRAKLVPSDSVPIADQKRIGDAQSELFATLDRRMNTFGTLLNAVGYKEGQRQLEEAETDLRTTERRLYLARLGKLAGITQGQVDQLKIDLFRAQFKYNDVLDFVSKLSPEQTETTTSSVPSKVEAATRPAPSSKQKGLLGTAAVGVGLLGAKLAGLFGGGVQEVKKKPEPPAAVKSVEFPHTKAPSFMPEKIDTTAREVVPPADLPVGVPDLRPRVDADSLLKTIEQTVPIVPRDAALAASESRTPSPSNNVEAPVVQATTTEGKLVKIKPATESDRRNIGVKRARGVNLTENKIAKKGEKNALPSFELIFNNLLKDTGIDIAPYLQRFERPPQKAIDALANLNVDVLRGLLAEADAEVKGLRVTAEPDMNKLGEKRTLVEALRAALKLSLKDEAPPKPVKKPKAGKVKQAKKGEKIVSPDTPLVGDLSKQTQSVLEARAAFLSKKVVRLHGVMAQATNEAQQKGGVLAAVDISESDRRALHQADAELGNINEELSRRVERPPIQVTIDELIANRDRVGRLLGTDSDEYRQANTVVKNFIRDNNLVEEAVDPANMEKPGFEKVGSMEEKFTDFDKLHKKRVKAKDQFGVDSDEYRLADEAYRKYMKDNGWRAD